MINLQSANDVLQSMQHHATTRANQRAIMLLHDGERDDARSALTMRGLTQPHGGSGYYGSILSVSTSVSRIMRMHLYGMSSTADTRSRAMRMSPSGCRSVASCCCAQVARGIRRAGTTDAGTAR